MKKRTIKEKSKLSIIGFSLGVLSAFSMMWSGFSIFAFISVLLCVISLIESIKTNKDLFYPIAGIILGIIFGVPSLISVFNFLCYSYSTFMGIILIILCLFGLTAFGYGIYDKRNSDESLRSTIVIIISIVILVLFGLSFISINTTEDRLEYELKQYAKKYFETDAWMNGNITPDTYTITLEDLNKKFNMNIDIFKKYNCNEKNTKVDFVVKPQIEKGKTNYEYVISLDCQ